MERRGISVDSVASWTLDSSPAMPLVCPRCGESRFEETSTVYFFRSAGSIAGEGTCKAIREGRTKNAGSPCAKSSEHGPVFFLKLRMSGFVFRKYFKLLEWARAFVRRFLNTTS